MLLCLAPYVTHPVSHLTGAAPSGEVTREVLPVGRPAAPLCPRGKVRPSGVTQVHQDKSEGYDTSETLKRTQIRHCPERGRDTDTPSCILGRDESLEGGTGSC